MHNETLSVIAVCMVSRQDRILCFKRIIVGEATAWDPAVRRGGLMEPVLIIIDRIGLVPV